MLLRDTIYQTIRSAILTCELQPGQELREQILAERYHVSRSPIRDSLLRLELENLVTVLPRQGYLVKPIALSDVEDIFGFRLLVEPACAVVAARGDEVALRALDRFRGFADRDHTEAEYAEYSRSFHFAIADLSDNGRIAAVARELMEHFERLGRIAQHTYGPEAIRRYCAEHEAIIDALQARDPERASRLCRAHVEEIQNSIAPALRVVLAR